MNFISNITFFCFPFHIFQVQDILLLGFDILTTVICVLLMIGIIRMFLFDLFWYPHKRISGFLFREIPKILHRSVKEEAMAHQHMTIVFCSLRSIYSILKFLLTLNVGCLEMHMACNLTVFFTII